MKQFVHYLLFTLSATLIFAGCLEQQRAKIDFLTFEAEKLQKEYVPIKFKVSEKTGNSIKFEIKMYDVNANEIGSKKFELVGNELAFDFYIVPVKDGFLSFPVKIFTDTMQPDKGIGIIDLYDDNGFPEIFFEKDMDDTTKNELKEIYLQVKNNYKSLDSNLVGNAVHDIAGVKSFLPGFVYKIVARTKGGIEVINN